MCENNKTNKDSHLFNIRYETFKPYDENEVTVIFETFNPYEEAEKDKDFKLAFNNINSKIFSSEADEKLNEEKINEAAKLLFNSLESNPNVIYVGINSPYNTIITVGVKNKQEIKKIPKAFNDYPVLVKYFKGGIKPN